MKCESFQQFSVVQSDSPKIFTEELNAELQRLRQHQPVVKFAECDPLCAYISYTERAWVPENLGDEYELSGVSFRCGDCPFFEPEKNADGSIKKSSKRGKCSKSEWGRTSKDTRACDLLYQLIKDREVKLCCTSSDC